jgi:cation diffusion facilitator family transporter
MQHKNDRIQQASAETVRNENQEIRRTQLIRTAGLIALFGNLVLCLTKLILARISGSLAVMGDGIDSATDVGIALVTLIISGIISRPGDAEHPWGHGRAETTATMALAFIIFFAGFELASSSVSKIINGAEAISSSTTAILAAVISIAGKSLLAKSQSVLGKKSGSEMILANAQNMKNDIIMSASVLIGLTAATLFKQPLLDPIAALLVSLWVIKNAIQIFMQMNVELMDGNTDTGLYKKLFDAVMSVPGVSNPHRARIRKISSRWDIDLDIEVDANMTVHSAHEIAEKVEKAVSRSIPDVYDIMVHIEPAGHEKHHEPEQFGLRESDVDTPEELAEETKERSEREHRHPKK